MSSKEKKKDIAKNIPILPSCTNKMNARGQVAFTVKKLKTEKKKSAALIPFRSDRITRLIQQAPTEICPIKTNVQSFPILSFLSNSSAFGVNGTVKMEIFPGEKSPLTNGSGRAGLLPAPVLCCQQEISVQMPCNQSSEDLEQSRHAYCLAVTSTFHLMTSVINQTAEDRTSSLPLGFELQYKSISFISGCKSRSILRVNAFPPVLPHLTSVLIPAVLFYIFFYSPLISKSYGTLCCNFVDYINFSQQCLGWRIADPLH